MFPPARWGWPFPRSLSEGYPPGAHVRVLTSRSPFQFCRGSIDWESKLALWRHLSYFHSVGCLLLPVLEETGLLPSEVFVLQFPFPPLEPFFGHFSHI